MLSFFKPSSGEGGLDHIAARSVVMLADARHSFDLATLALLTNAGAADVANDVRATDQRINLAEQEMRSELVVHVSVRGSADIGSVLAFTLLLKKIERIGDQAKNILELAENGVTLVDSPEIEALLTEREVVSALFGEAGQLLGDADVDENAIEDFGIRVDAIMAEHQERIDAYMTTERPGREVVPLAIYLRYLRRIVANLLGVVRTAVQPLAHLDYLEDGTVDTDD